MPKPKKEVIQWNSSSYRKDYINGFFDIDIVYHGANMVFQSPTVEFTRTGNCALYADKKLIFKVNRTTQADMMYTLRNYILSQMTKAQVDELEFTDMVEPHRNKYYGFYKELK